MIFGHKLRECRPIFKILSLTDSQEKKLYLWQKLLPVIYYVATLPCEIRCRYSEYFTFQHDEALSHRAWETIDLLKQTMPKLYSALSVAIQQSRSKSQRLCSVRNSAKPHLQEPCQRCRRAELQQLVREKQDCLNQQVTDTAIRKWPNRLQACTAADGGHFSYALWTLRTFAEM